MSPTAKELLEEAEKQVKYWSDKFTEDVSNWAYWGMYKYWCGRRDVLAVIVEEEEVK